MNQVQTFGFGPLDVRITELNGQPWFVAYDVADALGFSIDNLKYHAKQSFHEDEKRVVKLPGFRGIGALCLSESGVYKLVMRSRKPEAKVFQDWVTRVVLPAIRKDGAYVMGEEKVATGELSEDELVMRAMSIMSRKVYRLNQDRHILARETRTGQLPTPWMFRSRTSTASKVDCGNAHTRSPAAHNEYGCKN